MPPHGLSRVACLLLACVGFAVAPNGNGTTNALPQDPPLPHDYSWQRWTREHGLPDNRVLGVLQSHDGYLWIATVGGLARFDGLHWNAFSGANSPELPITGFRAMAEDGKGNLWVAFKHQLFRWNGQIFIHETLPLTSSDDEIGPICANRSGGIWVIAGPALYLLGQNQQKSFPLPTWIPSGSLHCLREAFDGLWLGHSQGLAHFDPHKALFRPEGELHPDRLPTPSVLDLERDSAGAWWILQGDGGDQAEAWLSRMDSEHGSVDRRIPFSNGSRPKFLYRDRRGSLWWQGGWGGAAYLFQGHTRGLPLPATAPTTFVLAIGDDAGGGVWFGTEGSGLFRCQPAHVRVLSSKNGLVHDSVWTVCQAHDGAVWAGTDGGVSRLDDSSSTHWSERDGLSKNTVRSIVEDEDGRIWIGTGSGLNWIEEGKLHQHHFPGEWFQTKIRAMLAGRNRALWVGTMQGLYRLDLARHGSVRTAQDALTNSEVTPFSCVTRYCATNGLANDDVRALLEDRSGRLWVGTFGGGLYQFVDGQFQPLSTADGVLFKSVWAIMEATDGALWLGTERGLARLKNGRSSLFTPRNGFPDDDVNHILEDNTGHLWVGGERGIYRLLRSELDDVADGRSARVQYVAYDEEEGLPSSETNGQKNEPGAVKTRDGRLWFPTAKGLVIFDPTHLPDRTNSPPVVIEQIRANGESIFSNSPGQPTAPTANSVLKPGATVTALRPGTGRILEIQYGAPCFIAPDKLRFKYRLDGLETEWTEAGSRRMAQFANLGPGHYRFQVLAANKYGVWNHTGASFAFSLAPFFWQTAWFKVLGVLSPILGGYTYYRRRLAQQRRRAESEQQTAVSRERADIARDLHDHLGARLTLVQHLSQTLDHTAASEGNSEPARQKLAALARELNASLDSAVWAVQPDKDTLASLADYLGDSFHELLSGTQIELELEFPQPLPAWPLSRPERYHLALVAIEALNNVLKHSSATLVRLRLEVRDGDFRLLIADNGCGFDPAALAGQGPLRRGGHGLVNMRQRLESLGGELELISHPGRGTTITLALVPAALRRQLS